MEKSKLGHLRISNIQAMALHQDSYNYKNLGSTHNNKTNNTKNLTNQEFHSG